MAEDAAAASAAAGYDAAALAEAAASMGSPGTSGETEQTAAAAVDDAAEVAGADRRAGSVEAGDLVAQEQKKAEEGGTMGVSLPEGWVSLPLNDRLMHHPAVPVTGEAAVKYGSSCPKSSDDVCLCCCAACNRR